MKNCFLNQVACPFSNQQNAYRNVTICPLTGQPIGQPAYNPNQRPDMYPGQGFNPNQRPNMYPSPSPCQAVRQLACGAAPGGSCGAQQQCCRQVVSKSNTLRSSYEIRFACFGVELSIQVQPDFMLEPVTPYQDYLCFVL